MNCRILPGHSRAEIQQELTTIVGDSKVAVRFVTPNNGAVVEKAPAGPLASPPALLPQVMRPLEAAVARMWPGVPVVPTMDTGASDDIYTNAAGMPSYEFSGFAIDTDDVRAHGKDERLGVQSFYDGLDFYYRFLKALTSSQ